MRTRVIVPPVPLFVRLTLTTVLLVLANGAAGLAPWITPEIRGR